MFFRFFTLFLFIFLNAVYSLKAKNLNFGVRTPELLTHRVSFINAHNWGSNRPFLGSKSKITLNLEGNEPKEENFKILNSPEPIHQTLSQDSTHNTNIDAKNHEIIQDYNDFKRLDDQNGGEIVELVEAALKWENLKIPRAEPEVTEDEIEAIRKNFMKGLEDTDLCFGQIVKKSLKAKEPKKEENKEDWRDVIEEFSIEVEGRKCYGCGASLQCEQEEKRGFVAPEYFNTFSQSNLIKCQRCSSLNSGTYFSHPEKGAPAGSDQTLFDYDPYQQVALTLDKKVKERLSTQSLQKRLLKREDEIMNRIQEASTETVNIVRNMLKIKKKKRITILYIVDAIDPHIELGLFELIKSRQEQTPYTVREREEQESRKLEDSKKDESTRERDQAGIKVYLVVNKIDLLPKYKKEDIIQYFRRMINSKTDIQLKSRNIFLISCKKNINVNLLLSVILLEAKKYQNQVLFIGPTNSGKSTLINRIHQILNTPKTTKKQTRRTPDSLDNSTDETQSTTNPLSPTISSHDTNDTTHTANLSRHQVDDNPPDFDSSQAQGSSNPTFGKKVTTSILPGTTLGVLAIRLGPGLKVYDTPGIFVPDSFISFLDPDQLKTVITNSIYPNKSIRLSKGLSLLVDRYLRIDVTEGRDFFLKAYLSNKLDIFVKKTHLLDQFIQKKFPNQRLYYPPHSFDTQTPNSSLSDSSSTPSSQLLDTSSDYCQEPSKLPSPSSPPQNSPFMSRRFELVLDGWNNATCDLCVKGIGFLTIGGALKVTFNLFTRKNVELYLRTPILPKNVFPFKPRKS